MLCIIDTQGGDLHPGTEGGGGEEAGSLTLRVPESTLNRVLIGIFRV